MEQVSLELNDKFCHTFGRVLIMAPEASSNLSREMHLAAMQCIPMLFQNPGSSLEIEQDEKLYRVTHLLYNEKPGFYHVALVKSEVINSENDIDCA